MATTTTSSTTWFSRIGSSLQGLVVGLALIAGSIVLLFWNENTAVKKYQSLQEGAATVQSVTAETVDPAHEARLIHFSGQARTPDILSDPEFGIAHTALKLKRTVEMYQWVENTSSQTVEKLGGNTETTTSYSYEQRWTDRLIDSSSFQEPAAHQNPSQLPYINQEWVATQVSVGAFVLPESMVRSLTSYQPLALNQSMFEQLPYAQQAAIELIGNTIYYQTDNPTAPAVGDIRIQYQVIEPQSVSVIGRQTGDTLTPYQTHNGRSIQMIQLGNSPAEAMFQGAVQANTTLTLILRGVGLVLLFIGIKMLLEPLRVLASIVPLLGNIVGFGTGLAALLLTIIVGMVVIAVAWFAARPLISLAIGAGIGALLLGLRFWKQRRVSNNP